MLACGAGPITSGQTSRRGNRTEGRKERHSREPAGGAVPAGPAERTPFGRRDLCLLWGSHASAASWLRAAWRAIGIKMLRCRPNAFTPRVLGRNLARCRGDGRHHGGRTLANALTSTHAGTQYSARTG